ncbi:hypothetical protein JCM10450v2_003585 [Rhodotorula kratochvilovae]
MVRTAVAVVALAASAYASGFGSLIKRQSLSDQATQSVEGLLNIAESVSSDVIAGNATADCTAWVTSLQSCSNIEDETEVAVCACGTDVLTQLTACAPAYGESASTDAAGFATFCTETLPTLTSGGDNATLSSAASSIAASATSALASVSSSASSAAVSASSSSASSASSAAQPSASASGNSAAGKTAIAGGLAGVVALVAAFAL